MNFYRIKRSIVITHVKTERCAHPKYLSHLVVGSLNCLKGEEYCQKKKGS